MQSLVSHIQNSRFWFYITDLVFKCYENRSKFNRNNSSYKFEQILNDPQNGKNRAIEMKMRKTLSNSKLLFETKQTFNQLAVNIFASLNMNMLFHYSFGEVSLISLSESCSFTQFIPLGAYLSDFKLQSIHLPFLFYIKMSQQNFQ